MAVQLTPEAQLGFHRPYTQLVKRTLTVANPNDQPIMFKVKTTAPKQYCVRPNSGRVEPYERVEVQVLLQPMKEDPPLNAKCRDKFLVQSALIPKERDTLLMNELWQIVEREEKGSIQEQKIRCVYLPPNEDDSGAAPGVNGSTLAPPSRFDRPPSEDDSRFSTVRSTQGRHLNGDTSHDAGSPGEGNDQLHDANESMSVGTVAAAAASTLGLNSDTTTTSKAPAARSLSTGDDASLRKELSEARAEIERLETQLKGQGELRQRTTGGSSTDTKPVIGRDVGLNADAGVPVQIVAGIAFGVFVFTWLFF